MAAPTCSFVDSQKIVCDLIRPSSHLYIKV